MSTTPFARRKRKKEEYEELPVIRMKDVPAQEEVKEEGEATRSGIEVPNDIIDIHLRLQREQEKTISHETVEHKGAEELLSHITNPDAKLPVIHAAQPKPVEIAPVATVTFTKPAIADQIKLGEGDTTLWREAVRPSKKGDKK